ncbi:hypothetical protein DPMN_012491 [Dreissena polymorpha]|uniref:Uncharacterized protein n=1 Tax=Dreissena polymorpha TaxID=45954 RepID=A0A9D4N5M1_DREPO|nr:hypothetical protein DPMN_012491 [Dreissena polymorpha]
MKIGKKVTLRVLTSFYYSYITIFKLVQDIIKTNLLTKQNVPLPGGHVYQQTRIILELNQDVIGTHVLTKFHEDCTINLDSRVLTWKNAQPNGGHVFQPTITIFNLVQDIIGTNLMTKFHEDRKINVALKLLTRKNAPFPLSFHDDWTINVASRVLTRKNAQPVWGQVFQPVRNIFKLVQDIIGTNLLIKFHED